MKSFAAVAVALGMVLAQGAPVAQAAEACEQRVDELEREVRELLERVRRLEGASDTHRTTTGAVFTRVAPVHRDFGESWRDPSGMIWGDIAKNADGSIRHMDQYQATEYCQSLDAQPPSREDFARLRGYMGATTAASEYVGTGYTPQVLPNLYRYRTANGRSVTNYFWSSSVHPDYSGSAYVFYGRTGFIDDVFRVYAGDFAVRCVARR